MMNIIAAAALVRIAAALPAPQQFDFAAVLDAPSPSVTGPPTDAAAQTTTYTINSASVAASISSEITTEATASVTGASASAASTEDPTSTGLEKRWLWDWGLPTTTSTKTSSTSTKTSSTSTSTTSEDKKTKTSSTSSSSSSSAKPSTYPASSTSSAAPTTSSTSSSSSSSSSSTPLTSSTSTTSLQSSTITTSSTSACPTTPEAGTYCGFINPEDPCAPQPDGYGPQVKPDTVDAFEAYPPFHEEAQTAKTPSGYVETFSDLNASTSANSYITFSTLQSYDVQGCADKCDNTDLCTAFNIYIERDPGLNPTKNGDSTNSTGEYCPNPYSITNYKCSLWGSSIDASSATNTGGWSEDFQRAVVASNGYDKTNNTTPPTQPGWSSPSKCSGGAISAGGSYSMGSKFYPGPYDPSVCAIYAQTQTSKNKELAKSNGKSSYTPCNMFNSYMVKKNGKAQGTYCSLFNTVLSDKWASFEGAWSGQNYFGVESSWTYALSEQDSGNL